MESTSDPNDGVQERAEARVGMVLRQKWRLDALLGVGGMAAVYAATHRNGGRGAVKMLHLEHSLIGEAKRRFLREGYVANAVAHPGVVRVLDDDAADDGSVFLVMELLVGETLDARTKRCGGALPADEVLAVLDQLLDVLGAAHARGVVHRDIKPDNVFITTDGAVKLLDFGIAHLHSVLPTSLATVHGSMFGTPAFMAPEQALGRTDEVDAQSDLWGVGALAFTCLAGRLVHPTRTLNEQLVAHAAKPAPSLAEVAPRTDKAVVKLVDRALAFDKPDRFPDAGAMRGAVVMARMSLWSRDEREATAGRLRVIPGLEAAAAATTTAVVFAPERRMPRWALVAGVALGVASVAGVAAFALTRTTPPRELAAGAEASAPVQAEATAPASAAPAEPSPGSPAEPSVEPSAAPVASAAPEPVTSTTRAPAAAARPPAQRPPAPTAPAPRPSAKKGGDWLDRQY